MRFVSTFDIMNQPIVKKLNALLQIQDHHSLKRKIISIQKSFNNRKSGESENTYNELEQILGAQTTARAHYYIKRMIKGLTQVKTGKLNDINLNRWKEHSDIITDSLWLLDKRDRSGVHSADYWGNFVPQIPNQLLRRFTKKGEWVLDPFLGSGTTLIECKLLGRNGIGIELQPKVAKRTKTNLENEKNPHSVRCEITRGDSTRTNFPELLKKLNVKSVQLAILHPPYWDIIKFSEKTNDLSNAKSLDSFINGLGSVIKNCVSVLDKNRYMAVVIGDKYRNQEWIPLGFLCMQEALKHDLKLKSIIIKNFNQTKAKRAQHELWRYRALVGGFYVFKHEYIFLFQKK